MTLTFIVCVEGNVSLTLVLFFSYFQRQLILCGDSAVDDGLLASVARNCVNLR